MRSELRAALVLAALAGLVACFDPLFEDSQVGAVAICCRNVEYGLGAIGACQRAGSACFEEPTCLLPAFPCAGDRCSTNPECTSSFGSEDAGSATGGGTASGGGSGTGGGNPGTGGGTATVDAGSPGDAGTSDAGPLDAGTSDAGTLDAGTVDAGTFDAGTPDAGTPVTRYEFCCLENHLTTCACPASGCGTLTFAVCRDGSCRAAGSCP